MRAQVVLAWLALGAGPLAAQQGQPPVMVHLADGSAFPLRPWSLSYEFASWRQGSSPAFAEIRRAEASEVWAGKRTHPLAGATLEIRHDVVEREREVDGQPTKVKLALARSFGLTGPDGKRTEIKLEPPHRDLLLPGGDKRLIVQARSLDLRGQTLTGTKREFCLASFTSLVECPVEPGQQVVRLEFPK